eukprot:IDg3330t1
MIPASTLIWRQSFFLPAGAVTRVDANYTYARHDASPNLLISYFYMETNMHFCWNVQIDRPSSC